MNRFSFEAIGTHWEIDTPEELDVALCDALLAHVRGFDAIYSRFRQDSLVTRVAAADEGGRFVFPEEASALFDLYDRLHRATDGAVDPLVGRDLELLGYDRTYSLRADPIGMARHSQDRPSWTRDVRREGPLLQTKRSLVVDVGAVGKGFLVDSLCELLSDAGIEDFLVDASGDMRRRGSPIIVGLEHPGDSGLLVGTTRIGDRAICASATNRRRWGDGLHHVVDGRTGVPVRDVVATWVAADTAALADGLATALFFTTAERLSRDFDFTYVRILRDGRAEVSHNFDGELFT